MSERNAYYCIYQSSFSRKVTSTEDIKTVSGCSCYGYCPTNTYRVSEGAEGQKYIQEKCIGHRLTNSNSANIANVPEIKSKDNITSQQFNILKTLIDNELNARKRSPLYNDVTKPAAPVDVEPKKHIYRQQLANLNKFISTSGFYKDTISKPELTIALESIDHNDINKTIDATKAFLNDCICYSDCNGYSSCVCYGNCNHY